MPHVYQAVTKLLCLASLVIVTHYLVSARKVDDWQFDPNPPKVPPPQRPAARGFAQDPRKQNTSQLSDFETFSLYIHNNFIAVTMLECFFLFVTLAGLFFIRRRASQLKVPFVQNLPPCKRFNNNKDHFSAAKIKNVLYTCCVCLVGLFGLTTFCYFTAKTSENNVTSATDAKYTYYNSIALQNSMAAAPPRAHFKKMGSVRKEAMGASMFSESSLSSRTIGLSVGGAKDVANFRENIEKGFLPQKTDVTMEGIFYDYFFDTGLEQDEQGRNECKFLFCPSYTQGISPKPDLSSEDSDTVTNEEYFLSIGLNSNVKEDDFARSKLNLVVVLDISGSMSSKFDRYYYDDVTRSKKEVDVNDHKYKLDVAKDALMGLLDHLHDDDRFGLVLFESQSYLAKLLNYLKHSDVDVLKGHIEKDIQTRGGTNFEAGYKAATEMLEKMESDGSDNEKYDNRIIFITDAMPNTGSIEKDQLLGLTKNNAENEENRIYTTFVGVGVDFNTKLIDYITKIRGANYYSVHSSKEFLKRMDDEFEYMVTPLVFDLKLLLDSDSLKIDAVYGSNSNENDLEHEIMSVSSLFPSAKSEDSEETKGGIILAKLVTKGDADGQLDQLKEYRAKLSVSYENAKGVQSYNEQIIDFASVLDEMQEGSSGVFENSGIRKGVLLMRYVELLHNWIDDANGVVKESDNGGKRKHVKQDDWNYEDVRLQRGKLLKSRSQWQRSSTKLQVSDAYREKFEQFIEHFRNEMKEIGDDSLEQEVKIMQQLIDQGNKQLKSSSLEDVVL